MLKDQIKSQLEKRFEADGVNEVMDILEKEGTFEVQEVEKQIELSENQVQEAVKKAIEKMVDSKEKTPTEKLFLGEIKEPHVADKGLAFTKENKGLAFARMAKMKIQHKLSESSLHITDFIQQQTEKHYSHDTAFVKMMKSKAMNGILKGHGEQVIKEFQNVSLPQDGGYLVPEMYGEIVELLRPKVFLFKAGARVMPMPNGNLNLPVHNVGALSYFLGEGNKAKGKKQQLENIKLISKKQVSMVIMSNELLRYNTYNADMAFLDDILNEMAVKMNEVALTGSGTVFVPKGVENYTGVQKVSLGGQIDGDTASNLVGKIKGTNVPLDKGAFVFNGALWSKFYNAKDGSGNYVLRDEMKMGVLSGYPWYEFNGIDVGTTGNKTTKIYFGDWSQFVVGEANMFEVATSSEATVIDNNGTEIQLFGQDCTAIKVTSHYDFALRHPEGFVVEDDVYTV